jgi:hypothetical protein
MNRPALLTAAAHPQMTSCDPQGNGRATSCREAHPDDPSRWCAGCLIAELVMSDTDPESTPDPDGVSWLDAAHRALRRVPALEAEVARLESRVQEQAATIARYQAIWRALEAESILSRSVVRRLAVQLGKV